MSHDASLVDPRNPPESIANPPPNFPKHRLTIRYPLGPVHFIPIQILSHVLKMDTGDCPRWTISGYNARLIEF